MFRFPFVQIYSIYYSMRNAKKLLLTTILDYSILKRDNNKSQKRSFL